ncbi:unnamed protein product [Camellia sinensis]
MAWVPVCAIEHFGVIRASHGKISKELVNRLMSILGHMMQLGTLKNRMSKSGIVESLLSWVDFKQSKDLKKTDGTKRQRKIGITKAYCHDHI